MTATCCYRSPIGNLLLAASESGLLGLWMEGQKYYAATLPSEHEAAHEHPFLREASSWLDAYFAGQKPLITDLPLAPIGGEFRQQVWKLLCEIPYGQTVTYGALSQEIAKLRSLSHMSAQAVGGAVGHNPISIIIPCHRVTGQNGSLTGYAGGISKKLWLLKHEGLDTSKFIVPTKGTAL